MLAQEGINWDNQPACFRRGSFFKRMRRKMPLGQEELIRYDIEEVEIELSKFNGEINDMLKCRVYPSIKK